MNSLRKMVVLLTGASRGIGPVIAEALVKRGANLVLAARSRAGLLEVAQRLDPFGTTVMPVPVDLRSPVQRERLISEVLFGFGKIDVLINNAGLESEGAFSELSWSCISETVEVNLLAPMALTRLVLPEMLARNSGHVVNIASIAAKSGAPYAATYSGTKAGLAEWTRALRLELAHTGVRFSTIFPGYVGQVGMFARFGLKAPSIIGSCSPEEVACAVVDSIEQDKPEYIVNSRPLRYAFVLNELSPAFGDWLMRVSGAVEFQRRKVSNAKPQPVGGVKTFV